MTFEDLKQQYSTMDNADMRKIIMDCIQEVENSVAKSVNDKIMMAIMREGLN